MNSINCNGRLLDLTTPKVMGILNVTPDSFYDGGKYDQVSSALKKVEQFIDEGVDIIDIGGMSSRPGAEMITEDEELKRVLPVIKEICEKHSEQIVSIDTVHSKVAEAAILSGASIVNDISGGNIDSEIYKVCIKYNAPYVLMHMQGIPSHMQDKPEYEDVILDILNEFKTKVDKLERMGLKDVILDPGFGFGKTIEQNYRILERLSSFKILDCPILVGLSRKSMLYKSLDISSKDALNATTAAHMVALRNGARILRVHDVKEAIEAIKIHQLIYK